MKKIGYLSGAPRVSTRTIAELSGPRAHVLGIIKGFRGAGWEVEEFIFGDMAPESWIISGSELKLTKNTFNRIIADFVRIALGVINALKAYFQIGKVDFVYERLTLFQALGWIFQIRNIPWILESNAILYKEAYEDRNAIFFKKIARWIELKAYKKADLIVCVSDSLKEMIIELTGISTDKVLIVQNGVDPDRFDPNKVEAILNLNNHMTIGFVGSIVKWQSLDLLLITVARLQKLGFDIGIIIIGDGPELAILKSLSKDLGISDNVIFTGRVSPDEVVSYIISADICYSGQVSLKGGKMYLSPLKLYEYLAIAKPVIASNYSDARALINESGAGYLFKPGESKSLERVIRWAYDDHELKEKGKKGRQLIIDKHSWQNRVNTIIKFKEKIMQIDDY